MLQAAEVDGRRLDPPGRNALLSDPAVTPARIRNAVIRAELEVAKLKSASRSYDAMRILYAFIRDGCDAIAAQKPKPKKESVKDYTRSQQERRRAELAVLSPEQLHKRALDLAGRESDAFWADCWRKLAAQPIDLAGLPSWAVDHLNLRSPVSPPLAASTVGEAQP